MSKSCVILIISFQRPEGRASNSQIATERLLVQGLTRHAFSFKSRQVSWSSTEPQHSLTTVHYYVQHLTLRGKFLIKGNYVPRS